MHYIYIIIMILVLLKEGYILASHIKTIILTALDSKFKSIAIYQWVGNAMTTGDDYHEVLVSLLCIYSSNVDT